MFSGARSRIAGEEVKFREFDCFADMQREARVMLEDYICMHCAAQCAVMFAGGRTPKGVYNALTDEGVKADKSLHVLMSDERYVPVESPDSNYGMARRMIHGVGVGEDNIMRVHTELPLQEAADGYDRELKNYIESGGSIELGILGLGVDGHTASLFSMEDLKAGTGRYAIAVRRSDGAERVTVTPLLLSKVQRLVFLAAGEEKKEIVERMRKKPRGVIAVRAVEKAVRVELWYSQQSAPDV